jgi:hypothetical protein
MERGKLWRSRLSVSNPMMNDIFMMSISMNLMFSIHCGHCGETLAPALLFHKPRQTSPMIGLSLGEALEDDM